MFWITIIVVSVALISSIATMHYVSNLPADQYEYIEEAPPVEEAKTADTDTKAVEEPKAQDAEAKQEETKVGCRRCRHMKSDKELVRY